MRYVKDTELKDLDIEVPEWIEQDITLSDVESIQYGGCASGAYMPAVTYHSALKTMNDFGDEILEYLSDTGIDFNGGDILQMSWAGMACHFVSMAVEVWATQFDVDSLAEALEEKLCSP